MPLTDEGVDQAVAEESDAAHQEAVGQLSQGIPPAEEPLDAANISVMGEALQAAMSAVSGGEFEVPMNLEVAGDIGAVPQDIGAALIAMSQMVESVPVPGLARYKLDPELMSTNAGILELEGTLRALAGDKALLAKIAKMEPPGDDEGALEGPNDPAAEEAGPGEF